MNACVCMVFEGRCGHPPWWHISAWGQPSLISLVVVHVFSSIYLGTFALKFINFICRRHCQAEIPFRLVPSFARQEVVLVLAVVIGQSYRHWYIFPLYTSICKVVCECPLINANACAFIPAVWQEQGNAPAQQNAIGARTVPEDQ